MLDFPRDEVHLWCVDASRLSQATLVSCRQLLTDDERAANERYRQEKDRRLHLVARALVRNTLSRYADVAPAAWRFAAEDYGKPQVAGAEAALGLKFNISHTPQMVVCAVANGRDVGVDVESRDREVNLDIADRFFARSEVEHLRRRPSHEQFATFLAFWTLKESYIKARGKGLSLPLEKFAFDWSPDGTPRITIDQSLGDDPARWLFFQRAAPPDYAIAVAVERSTDEAIQLVTRDTLLE